MSNVAAYIFARDFRGFFVAGARICSNRLSKSPCYPRWRTVMATKKYSLDFRKTSFEFNLTRRWKTQSLYCYCFTHGRDASVTLFPHVGDKKNRLYLTEIKAYFHVNIWYNAIALREELHEKLHSEADPFHDSTNHRL